MSGLKDELKGFGWFAAIAAPLGILLNLAMIAAGVMVVIWALGFMGIDVAEGYRVFIEGQCADADRA